MHIDDGYLLPSDISRHDPKKSSHYWAKTATNGALAMAETALLRHCLRVQFSLIRYLLFAGLRLSLQSLRQQRSKLRSAASDVGTGHSDSAIHYHLSGLKRLVDLHDETPFLQDKWLPCVWLVPKVATPGSAEP
jgi:hypothetical protein